ncbi:aromatic amino acid aminotransferase I [Cryptococcus neoformans]|nr:aromatic amino acid aminotransferase I [Cryptococcus neoformans var. grubii Th84]OXH16281.1 aromatic amino acid aminotransferase I [Cryptococcus neoformans var. grubii]OXH36565.1 aromatic amino acid aminotransferase I [Cryptococcus neoformans var. grubii]OXH57776.1 aromatic amino acid aminotransferase I [Cryptococcus neoformans var. grubii]OXH61755.1 aromatic amino acid aminotransferase I [Cryptococcus neoformans var. grubii]
MPSVAAVPVKLDYQSFLSQEAKGRIRSQLRDLRYFQAIPGMISFGGGLPHPSTWPVNAMVLSVPFAKKSIFIPGYESTDPTSLHPLAPYTPPTKLSIATDPFAPDLARDLQYSSNFGLPYFVDWLTQHVKRIHDPPYPEDRWQVLATAGNTDASDGVVRTLCSPGDSMLLEEFAFPGSLTHYKSLGINCVGVPMDGEGIVPSALEKILAEWNEEARGGPKPKAILIVPTCSNPSGITYPTPRKNEIYAICRKWNLLIIEDDPYCYLQVRPNGADTPLIPSFLSLDVDGRVVRLDSFSKFIAPGSRCGWITGPKELVTAVMVKAEASSNGPSGFAVASISAVIKAWGGHEGLERDYLPHISDTYSKRSNLMVSLIRKYVPVEAAECPDGSGGMFLWVRLRVESHPQLSTLSPEEISDKVFHTLIGEKVMVAPSSYFKTPGGPVWSKDEESKRIFVRLSFSFSTADEMEEGVKRFARGLRKEWGIQNLDEVEH